MGERDVPIDEDQFQQGGSNCSQVHGGPLRKNILGL